MSRAQRWIVVSLVGIGVFAATWWVAEALLNLDRGTAQALAGLAVGLVTVPAGWWFAAETASDGDGKGRSGGRVWTAVATVVLLVVVVGGLQLWRTANGSGGNVDRDTGQDASSDEQYLNINKTVWYAGLKVTVATVSYDPAREPTLVADVRLDNQASDSYDPYHLDVSVESGGRFTAGGIAESNPVPALAASDYHIEVEVDRLDGGLDAARLVFGEGDEVQAIVPVGSGEPVANEPRTVLENVKVTHRDLELTAITCELRADFLHRQRQTGKGEYVLGCAFDLRFTSRGLHWFRVENMRLRLPDGTSISPAEPPYELMQDDRVIRGVYVGFTFTWPMPGSYVLQIVDPHGDETPSLANTYSLPFTA